MNIEKALFKSVFIILVVGFMSIVNFWWFNDTPIVILKLLNLFVLGIVCFQLSGPYWIEYNKKKDEN
jgi:hypothetical protein